MSTPDQNTRAATFKALHKPGDPVVITNMWDTGSAKAVEAAGASALATGSASVAMAHGFEDGEDIALETLLSVLNEIVAATDLPVSADFEAGFAEDLSALAENIGKVIKTGVIGINFEDQIIETESMRPLEDQVKRIETVRAESKKHGLDLFINARTDLFLLEPDDSVHSGLVAEAKERLAAYHEAGASGGFVPGLSDDELIADICAASPMPVNILVMGDEVRRTHYAGLGVARISAGPAPYERAMKQLEAEARRALAS